MKVKVNWRLSGVAGGFIYHDGQLFGEALVYLGQSGWEPIAPSKAASEWPLQSIHNYMRHDGAVHSIPWLLVMGKWAEGETCWPHLHSCIYTQFRSTFGSGTIE